MIHFRSSSRMSPDPVWPGLFLPCSLPRLLPAAAGGGLEPSPARRFRGAFPHRLLSYAKEPSVADSFAHGTLRSQAENTSQGSGIPTRSGRSSAEAGKCSLGDEPERGLCFSHKMSLKERSRMLGIDHQRAISREVEPGTDPGVFGGQR